MKLYVVEVYTGESMGSMWNRKGIFSSYEKAEDFKSKFREFYKWNDKWGDEHVKIIEETLDDFNLDFW